MRAAASLPAWFVRVRGQRRPSAAQRPLRALLLRGPPQPLCACASWRKMNYYSDGRRRRGFIIIRAEGIVNMRMNARAEVLGWSISKRGGRRRGWVTLGFFGIEVSDGGSMGSERAWGEGIRLEVSWWVCWWFVMYCRRVCSGKGV